MCMVPERGVQRRLERVQHVIHQSPRAHPGEQALEGVAVEGHGRQRAAAGRPDVCRIARVPDDVEQRFQVVRRREG